MTPAQTDVDRVAKAICFACEDTDKYERANSADEKWQHTTPAMRAWWTAKARAALATMQPSVADAAKVLLESGVVGSEESTGPLHEYGREFMTQYLRALSMEAPDA